VTHLPSSQPSNQPSVQPTRRPTAPTGKPTGSPAFEPSYHPKIYFDRVYPEPDSVTYMCHPSHLHSTPNVFKYVFAGLAINSTVHMKQALFWITPYNAFRDKLSMRGNDYDKDIVANVSDKGVMSINYVGTAAFGKHDWDKVINMPAYKLAIEDLRPHSCWDFVDGKYLRTVHLQVIDRYGRASNIVTRKVLIKTSVLMYTNAKPVKISNRGCSFSLNIGFKIMESPLKRYYTNITASDAIDFTAFR